jgi:hypothetical protein
MLDPWRRIFTWWLKFSGCAKEASTGYASCLFHGEIHLAVIFGIVMVFLPISLKNNGVNLNWCC